MRDPYASLLLYGVKTIETRNHPMLDGVVGPCLLHVGHKTMPENVCAEFLWSRGLVDTDNLQRMMMPPTGLQRGQILGVMELGQTRRCSEAECQQEAVKRAVTADAVGRFHTPILKAAWLKRPLPERGQPGVWQVNLPADLLPPGLKARLSSTAPAPARAPAPPAAAAGPVSYRPGEKPELMPRLVVFDLDGVCWSPEMYQTKGGPPYRLEDEDTAVNSAGERIRLYGDVRRVWRLLHALQSQGRMKVAVASSSQKHKAIPLLQTFEVSPGVRMIDVVDRDLFQMHYKRGEYKMPHLRAILWHSGVAADQVLFLDDNRDNIRSVEDLGIVAAHVPRGLSELAWFDALNLYRDEHGI